MTEQPTIQDPHNPRTAGDLTPEKVRELNDRRVQQDIEHRELMTRIDKAFASPEAEKIRQVVREDGNVDWREFITHCGGILEVVAMVDDLGLPDTGVIIPKVDELFDQHVQREISAGSVFRRKPRNRPYVARRGTSAGEALLAAKGAGEGPADAERLLREEAEAERQRAVWSRGR